MYFTNFYFPLRNKAYFCFYQSFLGFHLSRCLRISNPYNNIITDCESALSTKRKCSLPKQEAFSTLIFNIINPLQRDTSSPWNEIILIQNVRFGFYFAAGYVDDEFQKFVCRFGNCFFSADYGTCIEINNV